MNKHLTICEPIDCHQHLREGSMLKYTVADSASNFKQAIVMPNLINPITTIAMLKTYQQQIKIAAQDLDFTPLLTLYLHPDMSYSTLLAAKEFPGFLGVKLYPQGATTHSQQGFKLGRNLYPFLELLEANGIPLLVHGEVPDAEIDIFDREKYFIDRHLLSWQKDFPNLKMTLEHVTTQDAVQFVKDNTHNIAATITPQHLLYNRNDLLSGGIKPHLYCLPILKRNVHQNALLQAATSGNPKFFLGTDSAPHLIGKKQACIGCAGCYSAPIALALYAEIFEQANALDKLEGFASYFGRVFYQLPIPKQTITLEKKAWVVPMQYPMNEQAVVPLKAGETLQWQIKKA